MYRTRVHRNFQGKPTRDDVAKQANISGATVSRVLSGRTDVSISAETRAKVLAAAEKLGYRPNQSARALTNGRTGLIGFWMSLQYSRYRGQVVDRMRTLLWTTEIALALTDVDEEYEWRHSFDRALRVPVDGIIGFDNSASVEAFASEYDLIAKGTPFVSMGAYWSERNSYVGVNLRPGADAAMQHLLSTGRRKIAYMAPWHSDLVDRGPRFDAYRDACEGAGLPLISAHVETVDAPCVDAEIARQLAEVPGLDAILCMNDDLAILAASSLQKLGLRCGHDVAIIGFDGIEETMHGPCPITTVRQPIEQMCQLAWDFLGSQMNDPSAPLQQKILTPELVVRESSCP